MSKTHALYRYLKNISYIKDTLFKQNQKSKVQKDWCLENLKAVLKVNSMQIKERTTDNKFLIAKKIDIKSYINYALKRN